MQNYEQYPPEGTYPYEDDEENFQIEQDREDELRLDREQKHEVVALSKEDFTAELSNKYAVYLSDKNLPILERVSLSVQLQRKLIDELSHNDNPTYTAYKNSPVDEKLRWSTFLKDCKFSYYEISALFKAVESESKAGMLLSDLMALYNATEGDQKPTKEPEVMHLRDYFSEPDYRKLTSVMYQLHAGMVTMYNTKFTQGITRPVHCLFHGPGGMGKGVLLKALSNLVPSDLHLQCASKKELTGRFNHILANKLILTINEFGTTTKLTDETETLMKSNLTDSCLALEKKCVDTETSTPMYFTCFAATNSDSMGLFKAKEWSRRFILIKMDKPLLPEGVDYDQFATELRQELLWMMATSSHKDYLWVIAEAKKQSHILPKVEQHIFENFRLATEEELKQIPQKHWLSIREIKQHLEYILGSIEARTSLTQDVTKTSFIEVFKTALGDTDNIVSLVDRIENKRNLIIGVVPLEQSPVSSGLYNKTEYHGNDE